MLALVRTVRYGSGGVVDDLATVSTAAAWLAASGLPRGGVRMTAALRGELVGLRQAVRALLAAAVAPAPPSRADAGRLPGLDDALAAVNAAAASWPLAPQLDWTARTVTVVGPAVAPGTRLLALLAQATVGFLASDLSHELQACQAPRCVRYFLAGSARQAWCKPACGNRARVARHHARQQARQQAGQQARQPVVTG